MAVSFPQLDVYYIDFSEESKATVGKLDGLGNGLLKAGDLLAHARLPGMSLMSIFLALGISLTPTIVKSLTQLINQNKFFIFITTGSSYSLHLTRSAAKKNPSAFFQFMSDFFDYTVHLTFKILRLFQL